MPMGRLGHARSPRRLTTTPMLPFERKASPSCMGRATVVNGRISCFAWLISRRAPLPQRAGPRCASSGSNPAIDRSPVCCESGKQNCRPSPRPTSRFRPKKRDWYENYLPAKRDPHIRKRSRKRPGACRSARRQRMSRLCQAAWVGWTIVRLRRRSSLCVICRARFGREVILPPQTGRIVSCRHC